MPKIRDLGINTIPVTMRPPEIGPGGGIFACHKSGDATSACETPSCGADESSGCETPSCVVGDETTGCETPSCVRPPKDRSPHGHQASAFSPAVIAQLRQQLEMHIGN